MSDVILLESGGNHDLTHEASRTRGFMCTWQKLIALTTLGVFASFGCRTPQVVTQLERENYALESKIWELVSVIEQKQAELEACRAELARLKGQSGAGDATPPRGTASSSLAPPWMGPSGKEIAPAPHVANTEGSDQHLPLPQIEIEPPVRESPPEKALHSLRSPPAPSPVRDTEVRPPVLLTPEDLTEKSVPDVLPQSSGHQAAPLSSVPRPAGSAGAAPGAMPSLPISRPKTSQTTAEPQQLVIAANSIAGRNYDGEPGDDGIALLLQPMDDEGRILLEPGTLTVVAVDPQLQGATARIARWELQPEELRSFAVNRSNVRGFLLELPWPETPPQHERLKVFVRWETPTGRRLETQAEVEVNLPGGAS